MVFKSATGKISSWFVEDLLKPDWPDKSANHIIQAVGASSLAKSEKFANDLIAPSKPSVQPKLYGSYQEVYDDPKVDCVYIVHHTASTSRIVWMPSQPGRMCCVRSPSL